jgi:hypothetical protein
MGRAAELLAQYQRKIAKVGQDIAIRRYVSVGGIRTPQDTATRAYVRYAGDKELIGTSQQGELVAYALVDSLAAILPVTTNDRLVIFDDQSGPRGKETAIKSIIKRTPEGQLIALEMHAVG